MTGRLDFMTGFNNKTESRSLWRWEGITKSKTKRKKNEETGLSINRFIEENRRRVEEAVVGPGAGVGVGCGVGVGFGLVGGVGYGGVSGWDGLRKVVFGVGMGCGVGAGFGYGNGLGSGISLESLRSKIFKPKPDSKRRVFS